MKVGATLRVYGFSIGRLAVTGCSKYVHVRACARTCQCVAVSVGCWLLDTYVRARGRVTCIAEMIGWRLLGALYTYMYVRARGCVSALQYRSAVGYWTRTCVRVVVSRALPYRSAGGYWFPYVHVPLTLAERMNMRKCKNNTHRHTHKHTHKHHTHTQTHTHTQARAHTHMHTHYKRCHEAKSRPIGVFIGVT